MKGKLERDWSIAENYCDYKDCCTFNYFRTFKLAGHEWAGYQCRKCGEYEIWRTNPGGPQIMVKVESDKCDFWSKLNKKKKNGYCASYAEEIVSTFFNDSNSDGDA